jgi:glutamyl-Q tRNA(Asp) synthetase
MHIGRFAPSPTGLLHFGSLVAALASFLEARARGGRWLVRMEDLDAARNVPGAASGILRQLEAHGLLWDGEVLYQSTRQAAYEEALARLKAEGLAYGCACSRQEIASHNPPRNIDGSLRYPGTCRAGLPAGRAARAWRARVPDEEIVFVDGWQGLQRQNLARDVGDFVVFRADGIAAYQLAVVVDDAFSGVCQVVRGADLLVSTARQVWLGAALGLPRPAYLHVPLACNGQGEKLSKQSRAKPLLACDASGNLEKAMAFLGCPLPAGLHGAPPNEVLCQAVILWHNQKILDKKSRHKAEKLK